MRNVLITTIVAFVTTISSAQQTISIKVGSTTRSFIQYTPSALSEKPALVISMHGLGGSGSFQRTMYSLDNLANKEKFIVVYPDGTFKVSGSNGWDISGMSDVNFISAIIDSMASRHKIDRNRVFATGFSMGGMMSYKLACTITDKIAAIAPASGYPMSKFGYDNVCKPTGPIPICHFHGTADNVVEYSGLGTFVKNFVTSNGCTPTATSSNLSSKIKKEIWTSCDSGSEIIIYHFNNMDHAYPTIATYGFSPNDTLWSFFKRHPRNNLTVIKENAPAVHSVSTVSCCNGIIQLKGNDPVNEVRVFDVQGKVIISSRSLCTQITSLDIPINHSAGLCIVKVSGKNGTKISQVIVR